MQGDGIKVKFQVQLHTVWMRLFIVLVWGDRVMTLLQFNVLKFNFVQLLVLHRLGAFLLSVLLPIITIAPLQAKTVDRSQNSTCP